jgi:hypothetical protein
MYATSTTAIWWPLPSARTAIGAVAHMAAAVHRTAFPKNRTSALLALVLCIASCEASHRFIDHWIDSVFITTASNPACGSIKRATAEGVFTCTIHPASSDSDKLLSLT